MGNGPFFFCVRHAKNKNVSSEERRCIPDPFFRQNVLVDCGFASTYKDFVAADLRDLSASGERLNLLVVTHIDADHIEGVIELLEDNGPIVPRSVIEIDEIWHNSLRCL